tara:strand:- start:45 stop:1580 length:1536 start_codon:yes stop_codon:yes gene_type:complete
MKKEYLSRDGSFRVEEHYDQDTGYQVSIDIGPNNNEKPTIKDLLTALDKEPLYMATIGIDLNGEDLKQILILLKEKSLVGATLRANEIDSVDVENIKEFINNNNKLQLITTYIKNSDPKIIQELEEFSKVRERVKIELKPVGNYKYLSGDGSFHVEEYNDPSNNGYQINIQRGFGNKKLNIEQLKSVLDHRDPIYMVNIYGIELKGEDLKQILTLLKEKSVKGLNLDSNGISSTDIENIKSFIQGNEFLSVISATRQVFTSEDITELNNSSQISKIEVHNFSGGGIESDEKENLKKHRSFFPDYKPTIDTGITIICSKSNLNDKPEHILEIHPRDLKEGYSLELVLESLAEQFIHRTADRHDRSGLLNKKFKGNYYFSLISIDSVIFKPEIGGKDKFIQEAKLEDKHLKVITDFFEKIGKASYDSAHNFVLALPGDKSEYNPESLTSLIKAISTHKSCDVDDIKIEYSSHIITDNGSYKDPSEECIMRFTPSSFVQYPVHITPPNAVRLEL